MSLDHSPEEATPTCTATSPHKDREETEDSSSEVEEFSEELSESTSSSGESTSEASVDEEASADLENVDEQDRDSEVDIDTIHRQTAKVDSTSSNLKTRLSKLLPLLQKANAELMEPGTALDSRIDNADNKEEHYIEMYLGLGVLQEMPNTGEDDIIFANDSSVSDSSSNTDELESADIMPQLNGQAERPPAKRKIEEISR